MPRFSDLLGDGDDDEAPDRDVGPVPPGSLDPPAGATPEEILERIARRDGAPPPADGPAEQPAAEGAGSAPQPDRSAFARLARETAYAAAAGDGPAEPEPPDAPEGGPTEPEGLLRVDDDLLPRAKRRR